MDVLQSLIAVLCCAVLLIWAWRILKFVWVRPKRMEKFLKQQGVTGNSYRLLFGDIRERTRMVKEAKSKPINFTHDIIPRVLPFTDKAIKNHGKYPLVWLGPNPAILIKDPELVREILAKSYIYQKVTGNGLSNLLTKGIIGLETDKWAKHRRLITPAFHMEKLNNMLPAFNLSCSEMLSKWEKMSSAEGLCELDVFPYLQTLTSDAISRTAFGSSYQEGREIFERQKEMADIIMQFGSIYIPGRRFLQRKRNRRVETLAKETESLILGIINKRLKAMQAGQGSSDDLLGILLDSNLKEIEKHGSKRFGMSFEEVIEECKLFYLAGQETTAGLLVWTLIALSKHSDWQARARDEVLKIFGEKEPDFDGLNQLKIVTMIFNEVLRLYPAAVMLPRMVHGKTKLRELTLPARTILLLPTLYLHQDENVWGSDAKEFNPERFSEGISNATKGQLSYFPFSWGPRICLGQNFAMLEAKMALAMILQRFSLQISPLYAHAPHTVITLKPQHGAQLILRKL